MSFDTFAYREKKLSLLNWINQTKPINNEYWYVLYITNINVIPCSHTLFSEILQSLGKKYTLSGYSIKDKCLLESSHKKLIIKHYLEITRKYKQKISYNNYIKFGLKNYPNVPNFASNYYSKAMFTYYLYKERKKRYARK